MQLYKHVTILISGNSALAFGDAFADSRTSVQQKFDALEAGTASVADVDAEIAASNSTVLNRLDAMIEHTQTAFESLEQENAALQQQLAANAVMQEGLGIVEELPLPEGFEPLQHPMSNEELRRYVAFLAVNQQNRDHAVYRLYAALLDWHSRVAEQFDDNQRFKEFTEQLRYENATAP